MRFIQIFLSLLYNVLIYVTIIFSFSTFNIFTTSEHKFTCNYYYLSIFQNILGILAFVIIVTFFLHGKHTVVFCSAEAAGGLLKRRKLWEP